MTKLEKLYDLAALREIHVYEHPISETKKAACMRCGNFNTIAIDSNKMESQAEETEILAEEIGHYETGALYIIESTHNTPLARSNREKYEAMARHWAIEELLPHEEIQDAIDCVGNEVYSIAEYCDVSCEYLCEAIEYYKTKRVYFEWCEE